MPRTSARRETPLYVGREEEDRREGGTRRPVRMSHPSARTLRLSIATGRSALVETHTQMRSESRTDYKACAGTTASVPSNSGEEGEMEWVARIGIDWADKKHDWVLKDGDGRQDGGVFLARPE